MCVCVQDLTLEGIRRAAERLVEEAHRLSLEPEYLSPFAVEGSRALSWEYSGGKPDDITIILAAVVSNDGKNLT